jgi:hypothetical protein
MPADPMDAALLQLAACAERLAVLEDRQATHAGAVTARLAEITALTEGLSATLEDQGQIVARLQDLDGAVAALAARLAQVAPAGDGGGGGYEPGPAPRWWKLAGPARDEAAGRLRAWVEQVFRPGYGQLAAGLGPCWEQHLLCLYGLDIAAELWSVLYLQPARTPAVLSAQAEYQARILPALAGQLAAETSRCTHTRTRPAAGGHTRSTA